MELNGTNGHATAKPPREQLVKRVQEAFAAGKTKTFRRLLESLWLYDDWGGSDLWDRVRPKSNFDTGDNTNWVPPSVPSDKRHGSNWPMWRTIQELDWLRQESRLRCSSNSYAIGLLRNLVNNVINKGFAYRVRPKAPVEDTEPNTPGVQDPRDQLVKAVQEVVDDFLRRNNWNGSIDPHGNLVMAGSRERETFRRVKRDGEAFLRFHRGEKGECIVRFIEPELIRDPPGGALVREGWTYGIRHSMDPFEDVEAVEAFYVFWPDPSAPGGEGDDNAGMGEELDASEVLHLKGSDTDSTVKRGTPAFVYETGRALDRAAGLQRAVSLSARVRASTAEIWQHQTATRDGISSMVGGLSEYQRTDPVTGRVRQYERIDPGSVRRIPAGQELVPNPPDQSQSYQAAGQGDLRQAAASECAPEFWMAETSSGNYSNLESAAAPAVRAGQCEQEYFKSAYARCVWKAIEWAAESGRLPENVADLVVVDVEAPAVLHRNELERAQEDTQLVQLGVKDRQTCAAERGLDWTTVERNNREYDDAHGQQGGGLGMPGEGGFPGAGGGEEQGGFPGEEEQAEGPDLQPEPAPGEGLTEAALPQQYGILDGSAADETLLEAFLAEAGFSGMKKDKLGRRMYYQDGKRIKAPQTEAKPKSPPRGSTRAGSARVKAAPKPRTKAAPKPRTAPKTKAGVSPEPSLPSSPKDDDDLDLAGLDDDDLDLSGFDGVEKGGSKAPLVPTSKAEAAGIPEGIRKPTAEHVANVRAFVGKVKAIAHGLSRSEARERALVFRDVLHAISPAQLKTLARDLKEVHFHKDRAAIAGAQAKITGKDAAEYAGTMAFYHNRGGNDAMHFDGAQVGRVNQTKETEHADLHGIVHHELAHGYDGLHSSSHGWDQAFKAEIELPDRPLSTYAATDPVEGFAEFGRLIGSHGEKVAAEKFPLCHAYWKREGLL